MSLGIRGWIDLEGTYHPTLKHDITARSLTGKTMAQLEMEGWIRVAPAVQGAIGFEVVDLNTEKLDRIEKFLRTHHEASFYETIYIEEFGDPSMTPFRADMDQVFKLGLKKAIGFYNNEDNNMNRQVEEIIERLLAEDPNEAKMSREAQKFISKEIEHLIADKGYTQKRAKGAAYKIARDKGYDIPEQR
jgi:hypothetical protein